MLPAKGMANVQGYKVKKEYVSYHMLAVKDTYSNSTVPPIRGNSNNFAHTILCHILNVLMPGSSFSAYKGLTEFKNDYATEVTINLDNAKKAVT